MCGIAGLVCTRTRSQEFLSKLLERWNQQLYHRGPDSWGWYLSKRYPLLLFHRRLAITGLGNGLQPICDEEKTLWMTFNGEIYNHKQLRKDLELRGHKFRSDTDCEVILHLYQEKGIAMLDQLNGDFAFSLFDSKKGLLHLVRDRFGVKPLYYSKRDDVFCFASEIKGILCIPEFRREFDRESLQNYLQTFYFQDETVFKDIKQLSPGHYLSYNIENKQLSTSKYYEVPLGQNTRSDKRDDLVKEFRFRFDEAVKIRIPEEVQVGAYLSGGLDSSVICTSMNKQVAEKFASYSIGFENEKYNELPYSKELSKQLSVRQHIVNIGKGDLKEAFLKSIWHSEIPVLNTHGAAKAELARTAKSHCKVVLTGEGADEMLMGYGFFKHLDQLERGTKKQGEKASIAKGQLSGPLKRYKEVVSKLGVYPYSMQRHFYLQGINRFMLKGLFKEDSKNWRWHSRITDHLGLDAFKGLDSMQASQLLLLKSDFPSYLLNYLGDRQEMSAGLEGRVPFLDHTLVDFMCSLPTDSKYSEENGKVILRKAFIGELKEETLNRQKQVFYAPAFESIAYFEDRSHFASFDSHEKFKEVGIFNFAFYNFLKLLIKVLPRKHHLLPIVESVAIFILSMHILHDFFIKNYLKWSKQYSRDFKTIDFDFHNADVHYSRSIK